MRIKNVRKTKSYVTKEKNFKSVKGLQRNFRKCILKNSHFLRISQNQCRNKKIQMVKVDPLGVPYHHQKYLHLTWEHPV